MTMVTQSAAPGSPHQSADIMPLDDAHNEDQFGAKSANLARALRAGLQVPDGFAVSARAVDLIVSGHIPTLKTLKSFYQSSNRLVAVRSSALGEDSEGASFAGQHSTVLGVQGEVALLAAIFEVHASASAESVSHYRASMSTEADPPQIAITIQHLINPVAAGVLFTRNPVTGQDERVVEAAWGLGEAVVASLVTPDRMRFSPSGVIVEQDIGRKHVSISPLPNGGTKIIELDEAKAKAPCLNESNILQLNDLANRCEAHFGGPQDIEWALELDRLYLLQSRPITTTSNEE